jgi:hypothetical protein
MPQAATDKCLCTHERHEHEVEFIRYGVPVFGRCEVPECMCGRFYLADIDDAAKA